MPRYLSIDTPTGPLLIYPVVRVNLRTKFLPLLDALQQKWLTIDTEAMLSDPWCIGTIEAIAALIPTYPENGLTIDLLRQRPILLRQLFTGLGMDTPLLVQLHEFQPIDRGEVPPEPGEKKHITLKDIPMASSGDPDADILADLIGGMESVSDALLLIERLDSESLDRLFFRLEERNDRARDPDGVMQRYLKGRLDEWISENQDVYDEALYGG